MPITHTRRAQGLVHSLTSVSAHAGVCAKPHLGGEFPRSTPRGMPTDDLHRHDTPGLHRPKTSRRSRLVVRSANLADKIKI
jgi:hypothetical protein